MMGSSTYLAEGFLNDHWFIFLVGIFGPYRFKKCISIKLVIYRLEIIYNAVHFSDSSQGKALVVARSSLSFPLEMSEHICFSLPLCKNVISFCWYGWLLFLEMAFTVCINEHTELRISNFAEMVVAVAPPIVGKFGALSQETAPSQKQQCHFPIGSLDLL